MKICKYFNTYGDTDHICNKCKKIDDCYGYDLFEPKEIFKGIKEGLEEARDFAQGKPNDCIVHKKEEEIIKTKVDFLGKCIELPEDIDKETFNNLKKKLISFGFDEDDINTFRWVGYGKGEKHHKGGTYYYDSFNKQPNLQQISIEEFLKEDEEEIIKNIDNITNSEGDEFWVNKKELEHFYERLVKLENKVAKLEEDNEK